MRRRGVRSTPDETLGGRAFGGAVWGTVQTVVMLPVNFLGTLLVARFLGPGDLGSFVALTVFLSVSSPLLDFGFGTAMQVWAGRAVAQGDQAETESLFRKALGFHLLVQQPGILLTAAFLLRGSPGYYFWCFAGLSVLGSSLGSVNYWLAAHNRLAVGAKRSIAAGVLGNVVLVAVAAAGGSPQLMWIARMGVQLLPALAVLLVLTKADRTVLLRPQLPRHMPEGFWTFARPMWITILLGAVLSSRVEVYILRWNDLAVQAGVFAVAFGLSTQLTSIFSGLHSSFGAAAVTLSGQSEERLSRALTRGDALFSVLASAALAAAAGLPHLVVPFYGSAYAAAAPLMLPLLVASTLQMSLTAPGVGAMVRRQRRRLLVSQAIAVVLDLGLTALLVPVVGLWGAGIGASAGIAAVNVALLAREVSPGRAVLVVLGGPWFKSCVSALVGLLAATVVPGGPWAAAACASVVAVITQLVMLRMFHHASLVEVVTWVDGRIPTRIQHLLRWLLVPGPREASAPAS